MLRSAALGLWNLGAATSPVPILLLGAVVLFGLQLDRPIHDVDIFWQVKLGELTLSHGLPATEPFLAGHEHEPLAPVAWLGQAVYAAVRLLGGWPLLHAFDAAVWFGGFFIVAWQCARRLGNDWPALLGLIVAWYSAVPHASLRPQSFAVLAFGLLIVLIRSQLPARVKLLLGALLFVTWQNLHPSVVLAVGALGATTLADLVHRRLGVNALLMLLAIVATVCTPAGVSIFAISKYNEEISKIRGITEWLPMWRYGWQDYGRENTWIALALTAIIVPPLAWAGRRPKLADVLVVLGLTAASLWMHRFSLFWAVAIIPVWADALFLPSLLVRRGGGIFNSKSDTTLPQPLPQRQGRKRINWRRLSQSGLIAITGILILRAEALFFDYFPFAARDALKAQNFQGCIYCNYFWGGVLADAGHPGWKTTHDGRYYLMSIEEWHAYDRAAAGVVPLEHIENRYHPDAYFLRKGYDDGLIARLRLSRMILFEDEQSIIFGKVNKSIIE